MSVAPFAEQERELLNELADLFALRAKREAELAARLTQGLAAAEGNHRTDTQIAQRAAEDAGATARAEHATARGAAEADFAARLAAATKAMNAEVGAFHQRTRDLAATIEARREETEWLAEAMAESGQDRILPAFEAARKALDQRSGELDVLEKAAQTLLDKAGRSPLPPTDPPPRVEAPGVASSAPNLEEASNAVRMAAAELERAVRPALLSSSGVAAVMLACAFIGAGAGVWRAWTDSSATRPQALLGAGAGAVAALGILLVYSLVARRRVPPATAAMHGALVRARASIAGALRTAERTRDAKIASLANVTSRERAGAQAAVTAVEAEVQRRTTKLEPELKARHKAIIDQIRAERDRTLAGIDRALPERTGAIDVQLAAETRAADDTLAPVRRRLEEMDRSDRDALEREWSGRIAAALARSGALAREGDRISPAWSSFLEQEAPPVEAVPAGVRFGSLRLDMASLPGGLSRDPRLGVPGPTVLELPVMVDLLGKGSVLLRATPDRRETALGVLNAIVLRLLTGLPPGKARFTIVDPVGLGQSFAGLMHISDYEEAIVGERIWTEARHIEQRLTDLTEHMETVIQKYLRNEYPTIQAYNAEAGEVSEPYRFLVLADFPSALTDVAAKRLASIATSGARCGVFILAMTTHGARSADPSARGAPPPPPSGPWADLERNSMVLNLSGDGARWADEPFSKWPIDLDLPPDEAASTRLLHRIGAHVRDSTRVRVPFSLVEPAGGRLWTSDAASEIRLPLGRAGAKKLQHLLLGRGTAQHALIAGRTGSGKSTLLHVIITTAAMWYSPDEIELYLVDFKKGVEFKTYAAHRLPHARVVAVESEREFGVSVLRRLDAELTRRGGLFRAAGVQDLQSYRRAEGSGEAGAALPRIMFVVDEFQEFFVEDDKLAQDASLLLDRLVRQGRAFGVHVVLGSQTLGGAYSLARSTLGQMAVRIALQCSEADSYLIMSEDNPAPRLLERPGEAIYNDASGLIEGNSPFQVVWLADNERDDRLSRVQRQFAATGRPPPPQIVFEGHIPADIAANRSLAGMLAGTAARPAVPTLWLGDPLAIKDPTGITLRHQSAASMLMIGNQEEQAAAMVCAAVLALAAWVRASDPGAPRSEPDPRSAVVVLDATPPDLPHAGAIPGLVRELGPAARLVGPRQAGEALARIAAEIDRRDATGTMSDPPALLVIHGLQRFRELRKSDEFTFSADAGAAPSGAQLLTKILRAGPSVGVHTLVWCDTATNADRMLDRSALREFNSRVLMQMSAGDSTQIIESPVAAALGANRALLYSDDTGAIEKFRPYALPSLEWIAAALAAGRAAP